jgi:enoyl-CoA hydratase/carnithine racemase
VDESGPASDELRVEDRAGVCLLTIDRPGRANSITSALAGKLSAALDAAERDTRVRVVVVTGAGERVFCAGADLGELSAETALEGRYRPFLPAVLAQLAAMEKPTIAALNGTAAGGGLELALACDLRIAASGARAGLPEVRNGMAATFGTVLLARRVPDAVALELLFTGDLVPVEELERWGLLRVVAAAELRAAALALAARIAAAAPLAVRRIKALARAGAHLPALEAMRLDVGPDPYASEDRREGLRAWREKRPPVWRDR